MAAITPVNHIAGVGHTTGSSQTAGSGINPPQTTSPATSVTKATLAAPTSAAPPSDTVNISLAASIQSLLQKGIPAADITAQLGVSVDQVDVFLPTYVPPSDAATLAVSGAQAAAARGPQSDSAASASQAALL